MITWGDGRVTPRPDRKLVTPVGSINQPQSYSVLSGTPRRAPLETATTFLSAISFAQKIAARKWRKAEKTIINRQPQNDILNFEKRIYSSRNFCSTIEFSKVSRASLEQ